MNINESLNRIFTAAFSEARLKKHKYLTPEHILYSMLFFEEGKTFLDNCGVQCQVLEKDLEEYLNSDVESGFNDDPIQTVGTNEVFSNAANQVLNSGRDMMEIKDIIISIYDLDESYAAYFLKKQGLERLTLLKEKNIATEDKNSKGDEKIDEAIEGKNDFLSKYLSCLNDEYRAGKLSRIVGRESEIKESLQILLRKKKNNPIYLGETGVGKTSIVNGLVQCIEEANGVGGLRNAKVFKLDMTSVVAGTKYRGDFEERLKKIFVEISKYENPIVFIDEIHTIIGAGAISGGNMDASALLIRYLEEGHIKFIGSTSYSHYNKFVTKNEALFRRFKKIDIKEPSEDETFEILKGIKEEYENFHGVHYSEETLREIIELSKRYLRERKFPDKAIDLMDEMGARVRLSKDENQIDVYVSGITNYVYEELDGENFDESDKVKIDKAISVSILSEILGIPQENIQESNVEKLRKLKPSIQKRIYGQDDAIEALSKSIKRSYAGLSDENKPLGSFLFVGPTGVGKTELTKELAKIMEMKLIRFDMSEYGEKHSVARLIGAPPGYVGYEEGGLLTDKVRNTPRSIILLDEIEKAHPDIFNILLQVMDYGTLTDSSGMESDFRNSIIIMTSNAGAKDIDKDKIGFGNRKINKEAIYDELKMKFAPEFLNRLDETIVFKHLGEEQVEKIIIKQIDQINEKLIKKKKKIEYDKDVIELIIEKSYSRKYGAREVQRFIDKNIKSLLVDKILFEEKSDDIIQITVENNEFKVG